MTSQSTLASIDDRSDEYKKTINEKYHINSKLPLELLNDMYFENPNCTICLDEIVYKNRPVVCLECDHFFHYSCYSCLENDCIRKNLVSYLFSGNNNNNNIEGINNVKCPNCRSQTVIKNIYIENKYFNNITVNIE